MDNSNWVSCQPPQRQKSAILAWLLLWTLSNSRQEKDFNDVIPSHKKCNGWENEEVIGRKPPKVRGGPSAWTKRYLRLKMMAYCSSVPALTKHSPPYDVVRTFLRPPIDCVFETPQTELFPTPSDCVFNTEREMHRAHQSVNPEKKVEQTYQKTNYIYRAYGHTCSEREQDFVFVQTEKKWANSLFLRMDPTNL